MKKRMLNYVAKVGLFSIWTCFLTSCGALYVEGYDDGIYGETATRYTYERSTPQQPVQDSYRAYWQQKANDFKDFQQKSEAPLVDTNSYRTTDTQPQQGYNTTRTQVNVYNHYNNGWGYNPHWDWNYRHSYYWGAGAWYPYDSYYPYYGYNYYRPYRRGWSISIGTHYHVPSAWYHPYHGYYYRYYPDYSYYGGYYDRGYYPRRNYSYTEGRYGDPNRYENYNKTRSSRSDNHYNYQGRSYDSGRYQRNSSPNTSAHHNSGYTPSYNSGGNDSGRYSRSSQNNSSSNTGRSGAGTTRRSY